MSTTSPIPPTAAARSESSSGEGMPLATELRRFSLAEYEAMIASGMIGEDDGVELLDGWIVHKMTRTPLHDALISFIANQILATRLPRGWFCRLQSAIVLARGMPEPDIVIVKGQERDYLRRHPGPGDIALVIEVAETSLDRDRGIKLRLYAEAGVPAYWIVNLVDGQVEVYEQPERSTYRAQRVLGPEDECRLTADGQELLVVRGADLLP